MFNTNEENDSLNLQSILEEKNAPPPVSSKAGLEFKSLFCPQKLELVPSRWDLWTSSYKIFMTINRELFYIEWSRTNRRESTHPSRILSAFWVNLGKNKTVQDFFLPLSSACKNSFDVGSKRNFLEEGMKWEGTKHTFLKSTSQGQGDESSSPANSTDFILRTNGKS